MREADMLYRFGEKDKAMEIMAKARQLHAIEEAKDKKEETTTNATTIALAATVTGVQSMVDLTTTPLSQASTLEVAGSTVVSRLELGDLASDGEDEIPRRPSPHNV
jgi:hypothetical protein